MLDFAISADLGDPRRVNVYERWESEEAVELSRGWRLRRPGGRDQVRERRPVRRRRGARPQLSRRHAATRVGVAARNRDDPAMTRPVGLATSLTLALAGTVLVLAPHASEAQPAPAQAPETALPTPSTACRPHQLGRPTARPAAHASRPSRRDQGHDHRPGRRTQRHPDPHALVTGIRFSDLGLPVDVTEEKRVLARTNGSGRFTLKQLREPYLVRVCSESKSAGGGGHRARRSGECDQESSKRFTRRTSGRTAPSTAGCATPGCSVPSSRTGRSAGSPCSRRPWSPAPSRTAPTGWST